MSKADEKLDLQRKQVVEQVLKDMKVRELDWSKSWSQVFSPRNPVSGTCYRGINRMLLGYKALERGYDDPRWVTFNQARENGWEIKGKNIAVSVEKWKQIYVPCKGQEDIPKEDREVFPILRRVGYWNVFNACEVKGISKFEIPEYTRTDKDEIADTLIASSRCRVVEAATDSAAYSVTFDEVRMPIRKAFFTIESFIRVLAHEMGHSTGHETCLFRESLYKSGQNTCAFEELVAELTALFCSLELGFDTSFDKGHNEYYERHLAYLQSWMHHLKDDPDELFKAASAAEKAAEYILDRYRTHLSVIAA